MSLWLKMAIFKINILFFNNKYRSFAKQTVCFKNDTAKNNMYLLATSPICFPGQSSFR